MKGERSTSQKDALWGNLRYPWIVKNGERLLIAADKFNLANFKVANTKVDLISWLLPELFLSISSLNSRNGKLR